MKSARRLGDLGIGEGGAVDDLAHLRERRVVDLARRPARLQLRHQRAVAAQVDRVDLALPRREAAVGREHAGDVRGVVGDVGRVVEQHEIAVLQHRLAAVIVRVVGVLPGGDEREVADALRPVLAEHVVGDGRQLALLLSGPRRLHRLEDPGRRDARRLADRLDLAPALHEAHAIEDRIEILDADLRRARLDPRDERRFARHPPVPGIGGREPLVAVHRPRREGAERLAAVRRVDRTPVARDRVQGGGELVARHDRLDAGEADRFVAGHEDRAFRALHPLVARRQEQRGATGAPVDQHDRPRHLDAGQVEDVVVLPEGEVGRQFGGALEDRHAVPDRGHHAGPAGGELLGREGGGEERLRAGRARQHAEHEGEDDARQDGSHDRIPRQSRRPLIEIFTSETIGSTYSRIG